MKRKFCIWAGDSVKKFMELQPVLVKELPAVLVQLLVKVRLEPGPRVMQPVGGLRPARATSELDWAS